MTEQQQQSSPGEGAPLQQGGKGLHQTGRGGPPRLTSQPPQRQGFPAASAPSGGGLATTDGTIKEEHPNSSDLCWANWSVAYLMMLACQAV